MKHPHLQLDTNWRQFRPRKLCQPEYRHAFLLLFWPIMGLIFRYLERGREVEYYHPVHSPLDDLIPFNELFLIPYLFWFLFLFLMVVFTFFYDVPAFRRMHWFLIITYGITLTIYFLFPNCQELRPDTFLRDNFLTRFMADFYEFDTHTNVCPSLHVVGGVASMLTVLDCRHLQHRAWKISSIIVTILISASTVFLKQHSILDVALAIPVCLAGYFPVYFHARHKQPHAVADAP